MSPEARIWFPKGKEEALKEAVETLGGRILSIQEMSRLDKQEFLDHGYTPAEFARQVLRQGPFLTEDRVREALGKPLTMATQDLLKWYLRNISDFREDAIAHLCLPMRPFLVFLRESISRIEQLENLSPVELYSFRNIGKKSVSLIWERLTEFKQLLAEKESQQSS